MDIELVILENDHLAVDVAPGVGGRVVSVRDKASGHEFLWRNKALELERLAPGSEYDPNFYGGIDELIPNDMPETVAGIDLPDHGELWTAALDSTFDNGVLTMTGRLPVYGLDYQRKMTLRADSPHIDIDYRVGNPTNQSKPFLWKMHAALQIEAGDVFHSTARTARPVDREYTRWSSLDPFQWPDVDGQRADVVPPPSNQIDFLYLYDLAAGHMAWERPSLGLEFKYTFDTEIFPYCWLFASYGGFRGHYTAVLEPCTTMPLSIQEANRLGQCSVLEPGETIATNVTIYAGPVRK